jgi:uncharacterized protein with NRDE domain
VREALEDSRPAPATLQAVLASADNYAAFNLLVGDADRLGVLESTTGGLRLLESGCYGLSNHLLDSPWPKLVKTRDALARKLEVLPTAGPVAATEDALVTELLGLLRDPAPAPDPHLPATGVSLEWERWLSPAFIRAPGYGTRCSSVVLRDRKGRTRFIEWTWDVDGELRSRVEHAFAAGTA